jgi:NAD(P)-dependent dehydrogenase (short-subunit alcohol dehydrogenase family)
VTTTRSLLLTGATSGLGLGLAHQLVGRRDWHFVMLARSIERVDMLKTVLRDSDVRKSAHFIVCDQAGLNSVREAAREIAGLIDSGVIPPLSSMVLNAGVMRRDALQVSADGLELTLATNLLGPHMLLALLSSYVTADARILIVGSNVIRKAWWHRITGVRSPRWRSLDEQCAPSEDGPEAYARSKLGLLYLSLALNRIAPDGISSVYFDPGVMPGTNILRERTRASQIYWREILPYIAWTFGGVTVRRAAKTLRPYALHEVPLSGWSQVCVRSKKRYVETDGEADCIRDYFDRANAICGIGTSDTSPWWWQADRIGSPTRHRPALPVTTSSRNTLGCRPVRRSHSS